MPSRTTTLLAVLAVGLALAVPAAAQTSRYAAPELVFELADERILEVSGLGASAVHDGVLWAHNDSGDGPNLFAVGDDGETILTFRLPVAPFDWEDLATGPGPDGAPSIWIADIGDNNAVRAGGVELHVLAEPDLDPATRSDEVVTLAPTDVTTFRLVYPAGPVDAESLLVTPDGEVLVVSKAGDGSGASTVYRAPEPLLPGAPNVFEAIATVTFAPPDGQADNPPLYSWSKATAGDVSADGRRLAVMTYREVWEWDVVPGDLAATFAAPPAQRLRLPSLRQAEALAYGPDARSLVVTSEWSPGADEPAVGPRPVWRFPAAAAPDDREEPAAPTEAPDEPDDLPLTGGGAALAGLVALLAVRLSPRRG